MKRRGKPGRLAPAPIGHGPGGAERAAATPIVGIEARSASTDFAHHVETLALYARRGTPLHDAVFEQSAPKAFCWTRGEEGWPAAPTLVEGQAGTIAFPNVGARLSLAEIYR